MPALSNGNTCWGNRKVFNFRPEYISDSFLFDLGNVNEDSSFASTPSQNFISSNSYYGYHRIPDSPQESMSVDNFEAPKVDCQDGNAGSRKRPNTQEDNDIVKRIRHQGPQQEQCANQVPYDSRVPLYDSYYYML